MPSILVMDFCRRMPALLIVAKKEGIIYIGAPKEAMEEMGDKIRARKTMIAAGVPVVPGTQANLETVEQAHKQGP